MELRPHDAGDYSQAMAALLPPGQAWQWPSGGFGAAMLGGTAIEPTRLETDISAVLDAAIEIHRPAVSNWRIDEYRRIAAAAVSAAQALAPGVEIVRVQDKIKPFCVGARVGDLVWSARARYILRVRYDAAYVDPEAGLYQALAGFKQSHVYLWMEAF